jgi:hypothetical protein
MTSGPGYAAPAAKTARAAAVQGSGARLDADLQQRFEAELGVNLAGARIHTGPAAERTAHAAQRPAGARGLHPDRVRDGQILRRRYYPSG